MRLNKELERFAVSSQRETALAPLPGGIVPSHILGWGMEIRMGDGFSWGNCPSSRSWLGQTPPSPSWPGLTHGCPVRSSSLFLWIRLQAIAMPRIGTGVEPHGTAREYCHIQPPPAGPLVHVRRPGRGTRIGHVWTACWVQGLKSHRTALDVSMAARLYWIMDGSGLG